MIKQKVEGKREREYGGLWAKARQKQHERQIRPVGPSPMVALTSTGTGHPARITAPKTVAMPV